MLGDMFWTSYMSILMSTFFLNFVVIFQYFLSPLCSVSRVSPESGRDADTDVKRCSPSWRPRPRLWTMGRTRGCKWTVGVFKIRKIYHGEFSTRNPCAIRRLGGELSTIGPIFYITSIYNWPYFLFYINLIQVVSVESYRKTPENVGVNQCRFSAVVPLPFA